MRVDSGTDCHASGADMQFNLFEIKEISGWFGYNASDDIARQYRNVGDIQRFDLRIEEFLFISQLTT